MNQPQIGLELPDDWLNQETTGTMAPQFRIASFYPISSPSVNLSFGIGEIDEGTDLNFRSMLEQGPRFLMTSDLDAISDVLGALNSKQFKPLFVRVRECSGAPILSIEGRWTEGKLVDARFMSIPGTLVYRMTFEAASIDHAKYRSTALTAMDSVIKMQYQYIQPPAESNNERLA